jgi:hypothetical protein
MHLQIEPADFDFSLRSQSQLFCQREEGVWRLRILPPVTHSNFLILDEEKRANIVAVLVPVGEKQDGAFFSCSK